MDRHKDFLHPRQFELTWGVHAEQDLRSVLSHAHDVGASDTYFKSGSRVTARVHGKLVRLTSRVLEHSHVRALTAALYGGDNAESQIRGGKALDNAYNFDLDRNNTLRFRWNATGVLTDSGFGIEVVLRELNYLPPKLDTDDLPPHLVEAFYQDQGMVLICGATGAGKSTLQAGIVRHIAERPDADSHILTFEAPIEYVYTGIETPSCVITQSSIPDNLAHFAEAVRNALRRDPDIVIIGESRDAETIKATVLAAQTGHLVYSTVHANSVGTVFLRLIDPLPADEKISVIGSLIDSLRVIVCQMLLPSTDGKRVAIREYLVLDEHMRMELLRVASENLAQLPVAATRLLREHGETKGQHARRLVQQGRLAVHYAELLEREDQLNFERLVAGASHVAP